MCSNNVCYNQWYSSWKSPHMTPPITFSTLACPAWSVETIIANARAFGYDGLEWRGGKAGHINPNASPQERASLRGQMRDANLICAALTGYTRLVSDDRAERAATVDELKRNLDLAADIGAPYVRSFVGEFPSQYTHADMNPRIVELLGQCVEHAQKVGVGIAVEHHDAWVRSATIAPILKELPDSAVGAVWDFGNAFSMREAPEEGVQNLRGRIFYVHVKDGVGYEKQWRLTNIGAGKVPLRRAIELLRAQNYTGALNVEWEYAWHPELEPPEVALPRALHFLRGLVEETYV